MLPFESMSLSALHAELAYWDRMVAGSELWGALIAGQIREWRDRCKGEIARREREIEAAA